MRLIAILENHFFMIQVKETALDVFAWNVEVFEYRNYTAVLISFFHCDVGGKIPRWDGGKGSWYSIPVSGVK